MPKYRAYGIGLGRTGTRSLQKALQLLGYKEIVHNPPFLPDIVDKEAAIEGITLQSYPVLVELYPDAKFILSMRALDPWLASCKRAFAQFPKELISKDSPYYCAMVRNRLNRYGTVDFDEEKMVIHYFKYHYRVLSFFVNRAHQLLRFNLFDGGGWKQLCSFLECPEPIEPFPCIR